jgi:hypothetical protein
MFYATIAPQAALTSTFGQTLEGPVAQIVVRNWGALIMLIGAMLIYGAFKPASRPLVLTVGGISKLVFISLVLLYGRQFLRNQVGVAIVIDSVMVIFFAIYLFSSHNTEMNSR